jgi:hypothetical protein
MKLIIFRVEKNLSNGNQLAAWKRSVTYQMGEASL